MTEEPEGLWTSLHSKADDRWQITVRQIQLKIQATLHEGSLPPIFIYFPAGNNKLPWIDQKSHAMTRTTDENHTFSQVIKQ